MIEDYDKLFPQYSAKNHNKQSFPIQFSPISHPNAYLWFVDSEIDKQLAESFNKLNNSSQLSQTQSSQLSQTQSSQLSQTQSSQFKNINIVVELTAKNIHQDKFVNWELKKIREDRFSDFIAGGYFGNFYKFAETSWHNIINPFKLEYLWNPKNTYFQQSRDETFKSALAMNSIIKGIMFKEIAPDKIYIEKGYKKIVSLLDLACGRGADLNRYFSGFTQIVGIDNDIDALAEFARRRFGRFFESNKQLQESNKQNKYYQIINTIHTDLNNVYIQTVNILKSMNLPIKYDAIVCNFAIHYFDIGNIVKLVAELLKPGGRFGFTCFDGAKIVELFKENKLDYSDSWRRMDKSGLNVRYEIKKMFHSNMLEKHSQKIMVKLPFTTELYEEDLVNIDEVIRMFDGRDIKIGLKTRKSFKDFLAEVQEENPTIYKNLEPADIEFNSLYEYVILEKR